MISALSILLYYKNKKIRHFFRCFVSGILLLVGCTGHLIRLPTGTYPQDQYQVKLKCYSESFLGTPYRYGGSDRSGMDCSGFVMRIYLDVYGINLPHNTEELHIKGIRIPLTSAEIGDLIFFREIRETQPSHIGIYMGQNTFIHVSNSLGVILSNLDNDYYRIRFVEIRRIVR